MTHIAETFRSLHVPGGPLLMINVWDRGSARMMAHLGAKALATSSAAHAFTMGLPDGGTISRDDALAHAQDIVGATSLPVQGDFENGFGEAPETCAETVRLAAEIGLAGICIEDTALPGESAYDRDLAIERIRAAAGAAKALGHDFVLTARADGILTGSYDTEEAIARLRGFADAGADCLYAPLPPDMDALARIVKAVEVPVNALVAGPFTAQDHAAFAKIGVARLSIGSALARVCHQALLEAGEAMVAGNYSVLGRGAASDVIDPMMTEI